MKNKLNNIIVGLVLVIIVGIFVYSQKNKDIQTSSNLEQTINTNSPSVSNTKDQNTTQKTNPTENKKPLATGITLAQVGEHNSRSSCFSVINGNVYDLTSWIPNHPGGESKILAMCGLDASASFNRQHGGESKPARILSGFKLGSLSQ